VYGVHNTNTNSACLQGDTPKIVKEFLQHNGEWQLNLLEQREAERDELMGIDATFDSVFKEVFV